MRHATSSVEAAGQRYDPKQMTLAPSTRFVPTLVPWDYGKALDLLDKLEEAKVSMSVPRKLITSIDWTGDIVGLDLVTDKAMEHKITALEERLCTQLTRTIYRANCPRGKSS